MKKTIIMIISFVITLSFGACSAPEKRQEDPRQTGSQTLRKYTLAAKRKVIIDTDTGGDDASALILAAKSGNLDIMGVTTLVGNVDTDQAAKKRSCRIGTGGL